MLKIIINKLSGHDKEGKIGKIYKQAGDDIIAGDVLFSIESGKGSMEFKSVYNGKINELSIDEGDTVKIGQEVGTVDGEESVGSKPATSQSKSEKKSFYFGINKPVKEDIECDVLVIGGGPGGYVAAIRAAQLGKKTIVIEKDKLGGTCLNYGCIPTKALVQSASILENIKNSNEFGFNVSSYDIDFEKVMDRKNNVVNTLVSGIEGLMKINNIRVINGEAVINDENTVTVKTKKLNATITYRKMIIATGASPVLLPIEGNDLEGVLTSKEVLELDSIPKSITIIGGGIIGMEMAFILNALGSEVNVVEFFDRILACLDEDASEVITNSAIERGINIYTGYKVVGIKKTQNSMLITEFENDDKCTCLSSEKVVMSVGRKPNLNSIDYKALNIKLNEKGNGYEVDSHMRTSNENIYAIGDITNKIQLAHVASHQGIVAAEHIAGMDSEMHYDLVPSAIFTMPECASVGVSEKEAAELSLDYKVAKFPLMACGKAIAMNEPEGFVKLIVDAKENIVLGGSIIGAHSTDLIATITQIISTKTPINMALDVIYAHPTLGESIHEALLIADDRGIHFG